jgi:hypothetical protein
MKQIVKEILEEKRFLGIYPVNLQFNRNFVKITYSNNIQINLDFKDQRRINLIDSLFKNTHQKELKLWGIFKKYPQFMNQKELFDVIQKLQDKQVSCNRYIPETRSLTQLKGPWYEVIDEFIEVHQNEFDLIKESLVLCSKSFPSKFQFQSPGVCGS